MPPATDCYGTLTVPERHRGINVTNNGKANISVS